ncbi:MAG: tRNA pseudouridine(38-40) synthase TruA [Gammaproteobacteria bacterium AqS3]|nr:tRNA pseudouridine(38-40) synthase TruA [Gammaproteobacteria bacterium AqS3]
MRRWSAVLQYNGGAYRGWQSQPHGVTVQQRTERVLSQIADHAVAVHCAGRTDAGVHALGQVIHFDSDSRRTPDNWLRGFTSNIAADISMSWVGPVEQEFHARHRCCRRTYTYWIDNAPQPLAPFAGLTAHFPAPLDAEAMHRAGQVFLGEHDFSALRAAGCQASTPVRCIDQLQVVRRGRWVALTVRANAFLLHMVRNMVGALRYVGSGRGDAGWVAELLAGRDRSQCPDTAPARGLFLVRCEYPERFAIPAAPELTAPAGVLGG